MLIKEPTFLFLEMSMWMLFALQLAITCAMIASIGFMGAREDRFGAHVPHPLGVEISGRARVLFCGLIFELSVVLLVVDA